MIRLFDFTPPEAAGLESAVAELGVGMAERIAVHELSAVGAIGGFQLVFR